MEKQARQATDRQPDVERLRAGFEAHDSKHLKRARAEERRARQERRERKADLQFRGRLTLELTKMVDRWEQEPPIHYPEAKLIGWILAHCSIRNDVQERLHALLYPSLKKVEPR